jgi:hypothetical protein
MSFWQLTSRGYCEEKYWVQALMAAAEERDVGINGKPALQDGGVQEALAAPDPGDETVRVQD